MDLINHKISRGVNALAEERNFITYSGDRVKNGKRKDIAIRVRKANLKQAQENLDPDYRYVLIDYRRDNEQVKSKMMSPMEAWKLNILLEGSGFAWARCDK